MRPSIILRLAMLFAFCAGGYWVYSEFDGSEPPAPSGTRQQRSDDGANTRSVLDGRGVRTLRGPAEMATAVAVNPEVKTGEEDSRPVRDLRKVLVRGRVVGPDLPSAAVPGAEVAFRTAPAGALRFRARCDEDGRFEARVPVGWRVEPVIQAEGFCTTPLGRYRRVESEGLDLGDLVLVRGQACTGRVVDANTGTGIRDARVVVAGLGEDQFVLTETDGRFRFDALAPGLLRLDVSAGGYRSQPLEVELTQNGQAGVEPVVELWPTAELVVRVVEAETGERIDGADVSIVSRGLPEPVERFREFTSTAPGSMRMFGSESIRRSGDGTHRIDTLDTGRYRLTARVAGRVPMETDLDLPATGDWPEVRVACPTGRPLVVRVFDSQSAPLPAAWVSLYEERVDGRSFVGRRRADERAEVRFLGLPDGAYRAVAQPPTGRSDLAPNSSDLVPLPARSEVSVSLLQPGRLEGTVTGVADEPVFVVCTDGRSVYSLERRGPGPFVIEGIGVGEYWLRALLTGSGEAGRRRALRRVRRDLQLVDPKPPFDTLIEAGGTTRASVAIDASETVDLVVEVRREGRSLGPGRAVLIDSAGREVEGVLDTLGVLRVLDVAPGRYRLDLRSLDGSDLWLTRSVVLPFAERVLDVP